MTDDSPQPDLTRTKVIGTITEYMASQGMEGGVELDEPSGVARLQEDQGTKYVVGEIVAKGGMGAILNARDCCVRRHVAMKVMLRDANVTDGHILRFIEEAQITGQLEHPNIVPVHELGVDESGNVFYTMKMVRGGTLDDIIDRLREKDPDTLREYPLLRLLEIFQRVCDALAFAHSKGVIHRDLKPENIMVGSFGEVLVMDWGLGKVLQAEKTAETAAETPEWVVEGIRGDDDSGTNRTMEGSIMGTPRFMSPEQAHGRVDTMDHRTDIYALGAILYNIISLRPPIEGRNVNDILMKVASGSITQLSGKRPIGKADAKEQEPLFHHCPGQRPPESLIAVAMKALALQPEDRYQDAQALQDDVRAYMTGFATAAEGASPLRRLLLFVKRHKALVAGTALVILGLSIGVLIAMHQRNIAVEASDYAEQQRKEAVIAKAEADDQRALAEKNLADFQKAEAERLAISKRAAPEFLTKAQQDMSLLKWEDAGESLERATTFDPTLGEAWYLYGHWSLHAALWEEARSRYGHAALYLSGEEAKKAAAFAELVSDRQGEPTADAWRELAKFCSEQDEGGLSGWLLLKAVELGTDEKAKYAAQETWIRDQASTLAQRLEAANPDTTGAKVASTIYGQYPEPLAVIIRIGGQMITNIAPLAGLPVTELSLSGPISDLSPLKGARLRGLAIDRNNDHQLVDLSPLAGMPLEHFDAGFTGFKDLTQLQGAPLRGLQLQYALVSSLDGLQGAPLTTLSFPLTKVDDLSPVTGAPLREVTMQNTPVRSLEPLRDAPLVRLIASSVTSLEPLRGKRLWMVSFGGPITDATPLSSSPLVSFKIGGEIRDLAWLKPDYVVKADLHYGGFDDLSRLAGSPLRILTMGKCTDFRSLLECRNLEDLQLKGMSPEVGVLRHHPSLQKVKVDKTSMTVEEFWALYDETFPDLDIDAPKPTYKGLHVRLAEAKQTLEAQLTKGTVTIARGHLFVPTLTMKITGRAKAPLDLSCLSGLPLTDLKIVKVPVRSLEPLRGLPLMNLSLMETGVSDLEPLRGMPLGLVDLRGCPVEDISPLTESPVRRLNIPDTLIEDLTPFARMRELQYLNLYGCERIKDLAPLLDIPFLEELQVPRQAANIRRLNEHKYLYRLGYEQHSGLDYFWKYYGPDAQARR